MKSCVNCGRDGIIEEDLCRVCSEMFKRRTKEKPLSIKYSKESLPEVTEVPHSDKDLCQEISIYLALLPFIKEREVKLAKKCKEKLTREEALGLYGRKCSNCGYDKNMSVLQFHHLKDKKYHITSLFRNKEPKVLILEELAKCVLLCANCHMEIHFNKS